MKKIVLTISIVTAIMSCQLMCSAQTKLTYFNTAVLTGTSNADPNAILREVVELAKAENSTEFYAPVSDADAAGSAPTTTGNMTLKDIIRAKAYIGR